MLNVQGEELLLLIVLAFIILGPKRLPYYAAKLGQAVRSLRTLAEGAKTQIKDELGPGFEDVDWRQLDPRQYDPRRIVREALAPEPAPVRTSRGPAPAHEAPEAPGPAAAAPAPWTARTFDPSLPTPFDVEAT